MRKILVLLTCLLPVALTVSACGDTGGKVATIGTSEITVSQDTPTDTYYERVQVLAEQGPYLPWFTECLIREGKKIFPPAEADELESAPKAEAEKRLVEVFTAASGACESNGRRYIDPGATEEEFEVARSSEVEGIGGMLRAEGLPDKFVSCVEAQVGAISTRELARVLEGEPDENERFFERLGARCQSG